MSIYPSNNPTEWTQLDGIYINEVAPPATVTGVGTGVVALVTQCDWGAQNTQVSVDSVDTLRKNFGYFSNLESKLTNLTFAQLWVVRAAASSGDAASTVTSGGLQLTAKYKGSDGNFISYKISDPTDGNAQHFKLSVQYSKSITVNGVVSTLTSAIEVYDNLDLSTPATLNQIVSGSSYVVPTLPPASTTRPTNTSNFVNLTGGTTGTCSVSDFTTAFNLFSAAGGANIVCSDLGSAGTDAINTAIFNHVEANPDRMGIVVLSDDAATSTSAAFTEVEAFRDASGRIIAVSGLVNKVDAFGRTTAQNTQLIAASTLSCSAPNIDLAYVANNRYFAGVTGLASTTPRTRANYIMLRAKGICAPEYDPLYGFKFKSGMTTQLVIPDLRKIYTRRMSDYLERSVANYLVNFQNAPNTLANRISCKANIDAFVRTNITLGLLPPARDEKGNPTYLIDIVSGNTPEIIAQNMFIIKWRQKLISSMDFIVLTVQIGASVVVSST